MVVTIRLKWAERYCIDGDTVTFWLENKHPAASAYFVRSGRWTYYAGLSAIRNDSQDGWKEEWPVYSCYHDYQHYTLHKYRDKLINEATDSVRTKHFLIRK